MRATFALAAGKFCKTRENEKDRPQDGDEIRGQYLERLQEEGETDKDDEERDELVMVALADVAFHRERLAGMRIGYNALSVSFPPRLCRLKEGKKSRTIGKCPSCEGHLPM